MTFAFRFRFYRDVTYHFRVTDKPSHVVNHRRFWSVLGALDYLRVEPINSITELVGSSDAPPLDPSLGGQTELILVPSVYNLENSDDTRNESDIFDDFSTKHHNKCDGVERLFQIPESDSAYTTDACRMVVLVRLSLSSITLDCASDYKDVMGRLSSVERAMNSEMNRRAIDGSVWTTLGGSDFVLIIPVRKLHDIHQTYELVSELRQWSGKEAGLETPQCNHCFSGVQANIAYRDYKSLFTDFGNWSGEPPSQAPKFLCRVTVGPGHEKEFIDRALNGLTLGKDEQPSTSWAYRSVLLRFDNIQNALTAIYQGLYVDVDGESTRCKDVVSLRTTILFPTHHSLSLSHSISSISQELSDRLQLLSAPESLPYFRFLNQTQQRELSSLFNSWIGAFRRNDRAITVRDLLPFFTQLGLCLNHPAWGDYLGSEGANSGVEFNEEFSVLNIQSWRAIRNRIEQRGEPSDPAFPNTLESGASKLVNAYTAAGWLGWEMLRDHTDIEGDGHCASNQFAACVTAGEGGRVLGETLFADFLKFARKHKNKYNVNPVFEWDAPLVLLQISGPTLFQPELAFARLLHEVAEFCDWLSVPGTSPLRIEINRWLLGEFTRAVVANIDRKRQLTSATTKNEFDYVYIAIKLMLVCLPEDVATGIPRSRKDLDDRLLTRLDALTSSSALGEFLDRFTKWKDAVDSHLDLLLHACSLKEAISNEATVTKVFPDLLRPPLERLLILDITSGTSDSTSLLDWCHEFGKHVNEVLADIGGWYALDSILASGDESRYSETRCRDINIWFSSMLRSGLEAWPDGHPERIQTSIAIGVRWATQISAIMSKEESSENVNPQWCKWFKDFFLKDFISTLRYCRFDDFSIDEIINGKRRENGEMEVPGVSGYTSFFTAIDPCQNFFVAPLSKILGSFSTYGGRFSIKNHRWVPNGPARELGQLVSKTWASSRNSLPVNETKLSTIRILLAFHFWAKSQCFCVKKLFV